ncbi:hypothetical protein EPN18_02190 [bacterium]|nr:MAG: hypothetical protein EPN18_02190 [bacterium]
MKVSRAVFEVAAPAVTEETRLASARGEHPAFKALSHEDRLTALFVLSRDKNPEVAGAALKSMGEIPVHEILSALEKPADPLILEKIAELYKDNEAIVTMTALNPGVSDHTLILLAGSGPEEIIGFLSDERRRLLKNPAIFGAMKENPLLPRHLLAELEEYMASGGKAAGSAFAGLKQEEFEEVKKLLDASAPPEECAPETAKKPDAPIVKASDELDEDAKKAVKSAGDQINIYKMAGSMTFGQKIKLALIGNKSAREFFAKDTNKLISSAVLKNPRITEDEVFKIASSKGSSDENLRQIARRKEWLKNYNIKLSLATNPKTPAAISIRLLDSIAEKDLQTISKSKNVPAVLASSAKRKIEAKAQKH